LTWVVDIERWAKPVTALASASVTRIDSVIGLLASVDHEEQIMRIVNDEWFNLVADLLLEVPAEPDSGPLSAGVQKHEGYSSYSFSPQRGARASRLHKRSYSLHDLDQVHDDDFYRLLLTIFLALPKNRHGHVRTKRSMPPPSIVVNNDGVLTF
jgi:hypothetical protein